MAVSYQETNTAATCIVGNAKFAASSSGAAGTAQTLSVGGGAVNSIQFEIQPGLASWAAGTWTVRLNVTTADMNLTVTSCQVKWYNSSCQNQNKVIADAGVLSTSLGSVGVLSFSCADQTGGAGQAVGSSDYAEVIIGVTNGTMSTQSLGFTNDQLIDTPLSGAPSISGTVSLPALTLASSLTVTDKISGTVSLAHPTITDSIIHARQISGSVSLPILTVADTTKLIGKISGSLALAAPTISDQMGASAAHISGTVALSRPSLSGSVGVVDKISGALALQRPTITDSVKAIEKVAGSLSLAALSLSAAVKTLAKVSGSVAFKAPAVVDTITVSSGAASVSGSIAFPSVTLVSALTSAQPAIQAGARTLRRKKPHTVSFRGREYDAHRDLRVLAKDISAFLEQRRVNGSRAKVRVGTKAVSLPAAVLTHPELSEFEAVTRALELRRDVMDAYLAQLRVLVSSPHEENEDAEMLLLAA